MRLIHSILWHLLCGWIRLTRGKDALAEDLQHVRRELHRERAEAERQDRLRNPHKYRLYD